ncbi:hypothetical protein F5B20DRAFT_566772 [Whalleya microplaca]|nr:hypothetical protein F5B20DRAFT_566772 [Whalleya microplaca]
MCHFWTRMALAYAESLWCKLVLGCWCYVGRRHLKPLLRPCNTHTRQCNTSEGGTWRSIKRCIGELDHRQPLRLLAFTSQ